MTDHFAPLNTAEVMDRAVEVYKKSFFKQILFSGIYHFASFSAIGVASVFFGFLAVLTLGMLGGGGTVWFFVLLSVAVIILWVSVSQAGHILLAKNAFFGEKVQLKAGLLPRMAIRVFFTIMAQVIAIVPYVAVLILFFAALDNFVVFTFSNIWIDIFLGLFVFIFWLFLFFVYYHIFSLSIAVSVFERKTFFGALVRSVRLLQGEFWKTFGARTLWMCVTGLVWMSLFGIFSLIAMGIELLTGSVLGNFSIFFSFIMTVIFGILYIAVYFLITPMGGVFHTVLYFNQRIKKEGLDIEIKLTKLERDLNVNGGVR